VAHARTRVDGDRVHAGSQLRQWRVPQASLQWWPWAHGHGIHLLWGNGAPTQSTV